MLKFILFALTITLVILWLSGWHQSVLLIASLSALAWGFAFFWTSLLEKVSEVHKKIDDGNIW